MRQLPDDNFFPRRRTGRQVRVPAAFRSLLIHFDPTDPQLTPYPSGVAFATMSHG